ncbi:hypothetical protein [Smaragdicoccus niigatensis]|uniref:hypothetical protein n=1 Tax=Smaragdicoccus niigatensis TaxID=359359 RepID=UPI0003728577|nr:hypothetical protein [Smaragdicoccus niigatensis]
MNNQRLEALLDLVELRVPLDEAIPQLNEFAWDSEHPIVLLTIEHLSSVIDRFLTGGLSPADCALWADAVEVRDGIGRQAGVEQLLNDFLFEVSAPEINGPLTSERAREWQSVFAKSR